jgi:hypothetical protein
MFYEGVRFIQIFEQNSSRSKGTLFTNLDTVHENELIKWIGTPFEFDKNVNLRLNLAFLAKD